MKLEDQMNLSLKTGHLVRQIDAVIEGLSVMRERLAEIPERYCEKDGSELVYEREVEGKT